MIYDIQSKQASADLARLIKDQQDFQPCMSKINVIQKFWRTDGSMEMEYSQRCWTASF